MVDTALGRLGVQVRGSGDAMMFWPSLLMTGDMWAAQADHFGDRCRVILVDPPGHGQSQKLKAIFDFADCARCIVDILDALGEERAHFVGNSWGGMIGGTFAATYPDRIGQRRADELHRIARGHAAEDRVRIPAADGEAVRRCPAAADPIGAQGVPRADDLLHPARRRRVRPGHREAVDIGSASWAVKSVVPARPDQRSLFAKISTPVLVVAGAEDATFPLPETIAMAEAIPGAAVAVLDGVAHLAGLENPPLVNTLIEEFVFRE